MARRSSINTNGGGKAAAASAAGPDSGTQAADQSREQTAGWATLLVGLAISGFLFWKNKQPMGFEEYYIVNIALLLWAPLVLILLFLRREAADFALTPGDVRGGVRLALLLFALFVPVLLFFAPQPPFQNYYLRALLSESRAITGLRWTAQGALTGGTLDYGRLLFHETVLGFYMFAWEWYFRGFLLFGLKRIMPVVWAALLQATLFAILHIGKPYIEVASSFAGGLLLAGVALRFRSFLPCFLIHFLISMSFDFAVLYFHFNR